MVIRDAFIALPQEYIQHAIRAIPARMQCCIDNNGGYIKKFRSFRSTAARYDDEEDGDDAPSDTE
jgi:hypothetical protein